MENYYEKNIKRIACESKMLLDELNSKWLYISHKNLQLHILC